MQKRTTELSSSYKHLEKMSVNELLKGINSEDKTIANCVEKVIPQIQSATNVIIEKMKSGGRLFYIGAGTSGRLGIVDASECPPTYGIPHDRVIGLIAGGDNAIRKAVEFAEDDPMGGWNDLSKHSVSPKDIVIGIAASGTTPYVVGAIKECKKKNIVTACITCNSGSPLAKAADYPIEVIVGSEFVTGSTRMKAGTAQKMVLNMISTSVMIKLGRVHGNIMIDMQLTNNKLIDRGTRILMTHFKVNKEKANRILLKYGSVRKAIANYQG